MAMEDGKGKAVALDSNTGRRLTPRPFVDVGLAGTLPFVWNDDFVYARQADGSAARVARSGDQQLRVEYRPISADESVAHLEVSGDIVAYISAPSGATDSERDRGPQTLQVAREGDGSLLWSEPLAPGDWFTFYGASRLLNGMLVYRFVCHAELDEPDGVVLVQANEDPTRTDNQIFAAGGSSGARGSTAMGGTFSVPDGELGGAAGAPVCLADLANLVQGFGPFEGCRSLFDGTSDTQPACNTGETRSTYACIGNWRRSRTLASKLLRANDQLDSRRDRARRGVPGRRRLEPQLSSTRSVRAPVARSASSDELSRWGARNPLMRFA